MKRTLMLKNQELLDFEINLDTREVNILDAPSLNDPVLASLGLSGPDRDEYIRRIIRDRCPSSNREDLETILDAFGVSSSLELVFLGHGLSLADALWYRAPGSSERWEDINFYDNEWDPAFGTAVLQGAYERLASCSPDVPELTTKGRQRKAWERREDGIYLLKGSIYEDQVDFEGALLSAQLCCRLFGPDNYQALELVERFGHRFTASPLMTSANEELVQIYRLFALGAYPMDETEQCLGPVDPSTYIDIVARAGVADPSACAAKIFGFKGLAILADMHAGNFGILRNTETGACRLAHPFDYDHGFGFPSTSIPVDVICRNPALAAFMCAKEFSDLDPSWDWSWYNPQALEGFEELIERAFAGRAGLPSNFGALVSRLFTLQLEYVNSIVAQNRSGTA